MTELVSRRRFLGWTAGAGSALLAQAAAPGLAGRRAPVVDGLPGARTAPGPVVTAVTSGRVEVVRPDEQLHLVYEFLNLELVADELVAIDPVAPSAIRVVLGSQHRAEGSIEEGDPAPGATSPVSHRGAEDTVVVLEVVPPVPFTLAALTDLAAFDLAVDPRATAAGHPGTVGAPGLEVTRLGLLHDLDLSPEDGGARVEGRSGPSIWDVRPAYRVAAVHGDGSTLSSLTPLPLRAVHGGVVADAFDRVPDQAARGEVVEATTGGGTGGYTANEPLLATELLLTLHGAFARLSATWEGTGSLVALDAVLRSGQDLAVTVTERGVLLPFGMPASVVSSTERRFEVAGDGTTVAVLVRGEQLAVSDVPVTFPQTYQPDDGRGWPFLSMEALAPAGPVHRGPISWDDGGLRSVPVDLAFLVVDASGTAVDVDVLATDRGGNVAQFSVPMVFAGADDAYDPGSGTLADLLDLYADDDPLATELRTLSLGGQPVAFADEVEPGSGATTKQTLSMVLGLEASSGMPGIDPEAEVRAAGHPAFHPVMTSAVVEDDQLDEVGSGRFGPFDVTLDPRWLGHGNDPDDNLGRGFLVLDQRLTLDLSGGGAGILKPELNVDLFGQDLGISPDLGGGTWNPLDALGDANLLGLIWLADLLGAPIPLSSGDLDDPRLPAYEITFEPPGLSPDQVCYRFGWAPDVSSVSVSGTRVFVVSEDLIAEGLDDVFEGVATEASITSEACAALVPGTSDTDPELRVTLDRFALQLPPGGPALALFFDRLTYVNGVGGSDLDLDLAGYQFVGTLAFLEPFREFLTASGTSFSVTPRGRIGLDAGVSFDPGDFNIGVVRVSDVEVSIDVFVPFTDDETVPGHQPLTTSFSVGTAKKPVSVAVSVFRGTGSFEIDLQPDPGGITRLKASFGVGLELAAGGLGVKGALGAEVVGSIEHVPGEVLVSGAFSLWGEITIWGVAGVAVAGTVGVTYLVNQQLLRAKGSVTGEVHVAWVRKDWRVDVREDYELGQDGGAARLRSRTLSSMLLAAPRPALPGTASFENQYSDKTWAAYCGAFA